MDDVENEVLAVVSRALGGIPLTSDSSTENVAEWDSLAYLVVADEIERNFGLTVSSENYDRFGSISEISQLVRAKT